MFLVRLRRRINYGLMSSRAWQFRALCYAFLILAVVVSLLGAVLTCHYDLTPALALLLLLLPRLAGRDPAEAYGITWARWRETQSRLRAVMMVTAGLLILSVAQPVRGLLWACGGVLGAMNRQQGLLASAGLAILWGWFQAATVTFAQEALFRGIILWGWLRPVWLRSLNPALAIAGQAVLYATLRVVTSFGPSSAAGLAGAFGYAAVAGVLLGILSYRGRSILPAWFVHWGIHWACMIVAAAEWVRKG